ncbi:hypothetical protein DFJ74DRAFT_671415 [Hyaloraphidium curvatum]|nr:hypothetical protein DFJ74DRAFT_671415 [Hyaloraphidium curvatum]
MDADIQGANLLVVTLLHPTKPYVDLFKNANSQTCLTPRSERTFSDSAPQTSAANCAATTLKPVTNSLAAIKSGFGGLQLYRFVVSMPSPGGDPTQGNGTIYSLCMRAVYPAVTPPTPAAPTSQCLDLSAPDKGVIDKKDAEVRFPLTISGVPGAITSLIITLQFYSPDMRNIETYVYSASSDTKSSYPIPITNATVANCAASNPKWTFRDDGFYKYDACDNTDLYPASALAELRGFPVSDTWYISAIDSNKNFGTSIAKVNELCLYFNGATPA